MSGLIKRQPVVIKRTINGYMITPEIWTDHDIVKLVSEPVTCYVFETLQAAMDWLDDHFTENEDRVSPSGFGPG